MVSITPSKECGPHTSFITGENITLESGVTPVADRSHQLTVSLSHHISNSVVPGTPQTAPPAGIYHET